MADDSLDLYGSDPFGRDYLYGLSSGRDQLGIVPPPQGLPVDTRPYDSMQATPRGFISGLFSDVLGRTLNMPDLPRTGIPSLDLLYMNRNPVFNTMGVGDMQKTAERISYGEPLTTGAGMTLRPRDETVGAFMTVAPFVGEGAVLGARAGRAGARMIGQEIADRVATGRSLLPQQFPETRPSLFAVEPSQMMPKPQAPVSDLGFYSAAEQAALNLNRNKGTGQSFLNDLMKAPDVKKDELSWIGLDDFLKDKPNVTKQEVQDFIASNKVDLQEVQLGGQQAIEQKQNLQKALDVLKDKETYVEQLLLSKNISQLDRANLPFWAEAASRGDAYELAKIDKLGLSPIEKQAVLDLGKQQNIYSELFNNQTVKPTKYNQYQLVGGENYREILLKLPFKEPAMPKGYEITSVQYDDGTLRYFAETPTTRSAGFKTEADAKAELERLTKNLKGFRENLNAYKSSHFDEPNILAHMRVNDRVDADGKKMLLIEEIQSDWHQAGREKGYKTKESLENWYAQNKLAEDPPFNKLNEEQVRVIEQNRNAGMGGDTGVPDAPFKDTWYQLALKRAIKYAADNGYERIGLTTGTQQAKRFDLSKQVDEIVVPTVNEDGSRSVRIEPTSGSNIKLMVDANGIVTGYGAGSTQFSGKKLNEVVGKEMADKILNADKSTTFKGVDLQVGGEGMKKYYDEIYPRFLEKYSKKWNSKVGETRIKTGRGKEGEEPIRYIDITPEMKEGVKKGQPLASAQQLPEMLASGNLDYIDPFKNPLLESTIG